ncbi:MAG: fasciclin domain-containing protein, partial [Odoribacter sp.]
MERNNGRYISLLVTLLIGLCLGSCDTDFPLKQLNTSEDYELIYDYVAARPDLSIYKGLCDYTGFVGTISTAGTYTALVPTDSAFQVLYQQLGITDYKEKQADYWSNYLKYHTLTVTMNTSNFLSGMMEKATLLGKAFKLSVDISKYPYLIFNNSAQIREANIKKQNGNIDILNAVIMPPVYSIRDLMTENGGYTKMLALFEQYHLSGYLTDSLATIIVEPDLIFEENRVNPDTISNLEDWLKYHIIPGERSFMSDLDSRYVKTLYAKDGITFNYLTRNERKSMYCNQQFPFCNRADYAADQIALNGVLHPL